MGIHPRGIILSGGIGLKGIDGNVGTITNIYRVPGEKAMNKTDKMPYPMQRAVSVLLMGTYTTEWGRKSKVTHMAKLCEYRDWALSERPQCES